MPTSQKQLPLKIRFVGQENNALANEVEGEVREFVALFEPLEAETGALIAFVDQRTKALRFDCDLMN